VYGRNRSIPDADSGDESSKFSDASWSITDGHDESTQAPVSGQSSVQTASKYRRVDVATTQRYHHPASTTSAQSTHTVPQRMKFPLYVLAAPSYTSIKSFESPQTWRQGGGSSTCTMIGAMKLPRLQPAEGIYRARHSCERSAIN